MVDLLRDWRIAEKKRRTRYFNTSMAQAIEDAWVVYVIDDTTTEEELLILFHEDIQDGARAYAELGVPLDQALDKYTKLLVKLWEKYEPE